MVEKKTLFLRVLDDELPMTTDQDKALSIIPDERKKKRVD